MRQVLARVHGRVQGVWFRAWTVQEAQRLGLDGWVRNRRDGTVEALFAGAAAAVEEMLRLCHDGPLHARVVAVETAETDEAAPAGFEQRPTA
ncbi:acylphosphatase [Tistlia consotensis]|uniref:Acylphosphatase n=1 Tax=Tistlia consotensis USBA 355 TaxID=560819 RepID=A0A1Y6CR84_9PROT|nr:acylphosphatase [Tistlia consotensis]SMF83245.1 acylphosphatase [Tistlia consotensis USBA 355]SNS32244.1 acylphosphatase [Tistlia consotensis]